MPNILSSINIYNTPILSHDDYIYQHSILINRIWDEEVINIILDHVSDDTDILDIGANIGLVTIGLIQKAQQRGIRFNKIHCFECDNDTFGLLTHNLQPYKDYVALYPFAVASDRQLCNITINSWNKGCNHISNTVDNTGQIQYKYSHMLDNPICCSVLTNMSHIFVPAMPLDDILYQFTKRISVIKMDIEGFELQALRGASRLIEIHRPIIILEIWQYDFSKIIEFLKGIGYSSYKKIINPFYFNEDYIFFPISVSF